MGLPNKNYAQLFSLLRELTGGQFKDSAIARILLREYWSKGKAPTCQEFAKSWLKAKTEHTSPNPEWAFLADLASGKARDNWKAIRNKKATKVMGILNKIHLASHV